MKRLGDGTVSRVRAVHSGGTVDPRAITDKTPADDRPSSKFVDASVSSGLGAMQIDVSGFSSSPLTVTPPTASGAFDMASMMSGLGH